jgi:hypothetical protein
MRRIDLLALTAAAVTLVGCGSGIQVRTDFDPTAGFSGYQTYQWAERTPEGTDDPRVYNDITARRIRLAVDEALQAKGFREASANADFLVAWHGAIDGKMSLTTVQSGYGYGYGWYGPGVGISSAQTYVNEWDEGTLLIDVIDAARRELVWRGTGTATLREERDPERIQANINEAAAKVLKDFPPGS